MNSDVINFSIEIATLVMSGVTSAYVTYRLNLGKDRTLFMRKKAEELYLAAHEFGHDFGSHLITYISVAKGSLDYNQMLKLQIDNPTKRRHGGAEMMTMLVKIYFPEIEPELRNLFIVRDKFTDLEFDHKQAYKSGEGVSSFWLKKFREIGIECDKNIDALEAAIVEAAHRYATSKSIKGMRT